MASNTIIEVRANNLYANGYHIEFAEDGEGLLMRDKITFPGDPKDGYHRRISGQLLDQIAYQNYNGEVEDSSKYWGLIADANNIHNPFDIEDLTGKQLLVPNMQKAKLF